jgi:hypothetical protein
MPLMHSSASIALLCAVILAALPILGPLRSVPSQRIRIQAGTEENTSIMQILIEPLLAENLPPQPSFSVQKNTRLETCDDHRCHMQSIALHATGSFILPPQRP